MKVYQYKIIFWITGLLTISLTLFSFILSFNALTDLATEHNVSVPPLFPFVVEFGVIVFSLNALYRSLNNKPAKWQWVLIIMSSLLAGLFNIIHANNDYISKIMAAMPSLFLVLSFETLLNLIRFNISNSINESQEQPVKKEEVFPTKKITGLDRFRKDKRKKVEKLISLLDENLDKPEIIKKLKVTPQTYDSYLLELQEMGYTNGHVKIQV